MLIGLHLQCRLYLACVLGIFKSLFSDKVSLKCKQRILLIVVFIPTHLHREAILGSHFMGMHREEGQ